MTIDERTSGGVIILSVRGRMTIDDMGDVLVVHVVRRFLREVRKHVLVDLAAVPYVDTTGLRDIVESYIPAVPPASAPSASDAPNHGDNPNKAMDTPKPKVLPTSSHPFCLKSPSDATTTIAKSCPRALAASR